MALLYLDGSSTTAPRTSKTPGRFLEEAKVPFTKIVPEGRTTANALCSTSRGPGGRLLADRALQGPGRPDLRRPGLCRPHRESWESQPGQWNKLIEIADGEWRCIYVTVHPDGTITMWEKGVVDVFDGLLAVLDLQPRMTSGITSS